MNMIINPLNWNVQEYSNVPIESVDFKILLVQLGTRDHTVRHHPFAIILFNRLGIAAGRGSRRASLMFGRPREISGPATGRISRAKVSG